MKKNRQGWERENTPNNKKTEATAYSPSILSSAYEACCRTTQRVGRRAAAYARMREQGTRHWRTFNLRWPGKRTVKPLLDTYFKRRPFKCSPEDTVDTCDHEHIFANKFKIKNTSSNLIS